MMNFVQATPQDYFPIIVRCVVYIIMGKALLHSSIHNYLNPNTFNAIQLLTMSAIIIVLISPSLKVSCNEFFIH